jgi:hypothetical protein
MAISYPYRVWLISEGPHAQTKYFSKHHDIQYARNRIDEYASGQRQYVWRDPDVARERRVRFVIRWRDHRGNDFEEPHPLYPPST